MDPEQLARLETALQSEQAKEILGTNLSENMLGKYLVIVLHGFNLYLCQIIQINVQN
jgi:hypothetical protein